MTIRPDTGPWSGFADGFGERSAAVDAAGRPVERLRLAPVWTPARQRLAERIASLDVECTALVRALTLEVDEPSGSLILTSEPPCGWRLSGLLRMATAQMIVADVGAALFLMRRLLAIADELQTITGESCFGIGLDRIVVTASGRAMIVEPALAALTPAPRAAADVAGIAVAGLAVLLGHAIEDAGNLDPLSPVLQEAAEVAAIRAGDQFGNDLRLWFDRAIINDPSHAYHSFRQARLELLAIKPPRDARCAASRRVLKAFVDLLTTDQGMAEREASRMRAIRARQQTRWKSVGAPDGEPLAVGDELVAAARPAPIDIDIEAETIDRPYVIGSQAAAIGQPPEIDAPPVPDHDSPPAIEGPAVPTPPPAARSWLRSIAQHLGLASSAQSPAPAEEISLPSGVAPFEAPRMEEVPDFGRSAPEAEQASFTTWTDPAQERTAKPEEEIAGEAAVEEPAFGEAEPAFVEHELPTLPAAAPASIGEEFPAVVATEPATIEEALRRIFSAEPASIGQELPAVVATEPATIEEELPGVLAAESPSIQQEPPAVLAAEPSAIEEVPAESRSFGDRPVDLAETEVLAGAVEEPTGQALGNHRWFDTITSSADFSSADELVSEQPIEAEPLLSEGRLENKGPLDKAATVTPPSNLTPLSDDDHRSWIRAITEQIGLLRPHDPPVETAAPRPTAFDEAEVPFAHQPAENPLPSTPGRNQGDESSQLDHDRSEAEAPIAATWVGAEVRPELEAQPVRETWPESEVLPLLEGPPTQPEPEAQPEARREFEAQSELEAWRELEAPPEVASPPASEALPELEAPPQLAPWREPGGWPQFASGQEEAVPAARADATSAARFLSLPGETAQYAAPRAETWRYEQEIAPAIQPEALPTARPPILKRMVEHAREWRRTIVTLLVVSIGLAGLTAITAAGRSYYARITAPGTVVVESTPQGSEVLVDGAARGVTPLTLTLQPGDHLLVLRRNGLTQRVPIAVAAGAQLSQRLDWSNVKPTGTLIITSSPPGAKALVDGRDHGVTPLTLSEVPVGVRHVILESSAGTVRRDVRVEADREVTIDENIVSGWIAAFAPFELQVFDGARRLGTTDDGRIMVPPGRHELIFVNERLGYRERRTVEVTPGTTTPVNITSAVGVVRITAAAGAEVSIDGARIGQTPLDAVQVPIGTHEVVVRHPQLGDRKLSITVGASAPAEVNIDFPER